MLHIQAKGFNEAYPKILETIKEEGTDIVTRDMAVKEVENMSFTLTDPLQCTSMHKVRSFNFAYAVIEMLALMMPGKDVVEPLIWYNSNMRDFLNKDTGLFDGSYADRLSRYEQMRYVYLVLRNDPNSRRAVLDLYNAAHDQHESKDICCTLNIVFRIRDGKLNMTYFMRGNDALWGIYDYTQFVFLQTVLATWLGVKVGTYTHVVGSFHYYLEREDQVDRVIENRDKLRKDHPFERMKEWDIKNTQHTFLEIKAFFKAEKLYREQKIFEAQQIIDKFIRSEFLKYYWEKIIKPFVDKKVKKSS